MAAIKILQDFKEQMKLLLDDLIEVFPQEGDLVVLRVFLVDQLSIQEVMYNFIVHILGKWKEKVKKRDATFFLENDDPFGSMPAGAQNKVGHFRRMWLSPNLDKEDRNMIWEYFDVFLRLADQYKRVTGIKVGKSVESKTN